ncbi:MAG: peptidase M15 [Desulfobulbaceae bacterium A2]|nr:MAG: peptidase M15 [Desulfobulbaceae bacterium A2]
MQQTLTALILLVSMLCAPLPGGAAQTVPAELPPGFVYLDTVVADVRQDLRYATAQNFIGEPIDGYHGSRVILTREAAAAVAGVQDDLRPFGLGLKVFDGYRPQRAVDHFVRWAADLNDTRMRAEYYPDVDKKDLFKEGYIAERSSHSRGSTVDLTLVALIGDQAGEELDMGGSFDLFSPRSWPTSEGVSPPARAHRLLLHTLMVKHGFTPYAQEWWHFTLKAEPFADTFFNFPVQ